MARNDIEYKSAIGMTTVSEANSNLDGSGATQEVYKAEGNVTMNRVVIKAMQSTSEGMVRLFISDPDRKITKLISEVKISSRVQSVTVPTISQVVGFPGGFVLEEGYSLIASTQNAEKFNVIMEGREWKFPKSETKIKQAGVTAMSTVDTPNSNLDGSGALTTIIKSEKLNSGTNINSLSIQSISSTNNGMLRLFMQNDKDEIKLIRELRVPETTQSNVVPSYGRMISFGGGLSLPKGYALLASTEQKNTFEFVAEGYSWDYLGV